MPELVATKPNSAVPAIAAEPKAPKKKEIGALGVIRILPIAGVLVDHIYPIGRHQSVSLLLILSGYVMMLGYSELKLQFAPLMRFAVARLSRLWPVHLFTLALLLACNYSVFKIHNADIPKFLCNVFLVQAWVPIYKVCFSYNGASWASSALLFLYAAFPLLLLAMRKNWHWVLPLTALPAVAMIAYSNWLGVAEGCKEQVWQCYIFPPSRLFEFAVGMYAAYALQKLPSLKQLSAARATMLEIAAIAIFSVCFWFGPQMGEVAKPLVGNAGAFWIAYNGSTMIPWCLFVMILTTERGLIAKALDNAPLRYLGTLTFGIYMLHSVLLATISIHFPNANPVYMWTGFAIALLCGCALMEQFVEKPTRNWMMRTADKWLSRRNAETTVAVEGRSVS